MSDERGNTHSEVTATLLPVGSGATQRIEIPCALVTRPSCTGFASGPGLKASYLLTSPSLLPDSQQFACKGR